jgi:probable H4MPT-linked C1 transfer pathway protein
LNKKLLYLGVDIGGAHIKIVGLDQFQNICLIKYRKCYLWKNQKKLKQEITFINSLSSNKNIFCGVTMTAELCDIFPDRLTGAKKILNECKRIKFKTFLYSRSDKVFEKLQSNNFSNIMSMNWHSIGKYLTSFVKNALIIDFGSTTTDFICIKNGKIMNKAFNDFQRLSNGEILYTGLMRTPLFAIKRNVKYKSKNISIIPENFSNTSDIYRINKQIKKEFDIDDETDFSDKNVIGSYKRIARSFGMDYHSKDKLFIKKLSENIMNEQLNMISENTEKLLQIFNMEKKSLIILSGIGQEVLKKLFKNNKVKLLEDYFKSQNSLNKKHATYHAPAACIAGLLAKIIE